MGLFRNELTVTTGHTQKSIFRLIEKFANINMTEEAIDEAGICQTCFLKFNEYDDHMLQAEKIQEALMTLFKASNTALKLKFVDVATEESSEKSDWLEQQQQSEEEELNLKVSTHNQTKNEEGFRVLEINNRRAYQCELCLRVFKQEKKLKSHRQAHASGRSFNCRVSNFKDNI